VALNGADGRLYAALRRIRRVVEMTDEAGWEDILNEIKEFAAHLVWLIDNTNGDPKTPDEILREIRKYTQSSKKDMVNLAEAVLKAILYYKEQGPFPPP
jgi:hypothetical protein